MLIYIGFLCCRKVLIDIKNKEINKTRMNKQISRKHFSSYLLDKMLEYKFEHIEVDGIELGQHHAQSQQSAASI